MSKGVAVVVGASRGIGKALSEALQKEGYKTFGTVRKMTPDLEKVDFNVIEGVDVTKVECKEVLAKGLKNEAKIDVFVFNSGIGDDAGWARRSITELDKEKTLHFMSVNMFGAAYSVQALYDKLSQGGSKLFFTSSRVGSCADNTSGGLYEYRMSKTALNMLCCSLAHELSGKATVIIAHPGHVSTAMTGNTGIQVSESVAGYMHQIASVKESDSGKFLHVVTGEVLPW